MNTDRSDSPFADLQGVAGTLSKIGASAFLQAIQDGLQIWAADGTLQYANPATFRQFDLPPDAPLRDCGDLLANCVDIDGNPAGSCDCSICTLAGDDGLAKETLLRVRTLKEDRWLRIQGHRLKGDDVMGFPAGVITLSVDVTDFIRRQLALQQQAQYDVLTELPNRALFADRLKHSLATAQRRNEMLAVCMLDLDGFKPVNDTLGHKAGDQLLQEIAYRIGEVVRSDDTAARLGGDEFALVLCGLRSASELEQVLNRLLQEVARPVLIDGKPVGVTASIGVSLFSGGVGDPELLLRRADQAMYKAKEMGRGRYHIFDPAVATKLNASRMLLKKIQGGIDKGEFRLFYQPKVDCRSGRVTGFEALVRWQHPVLGLRSPSEFLPLIEHDDAIIVLGEWVIATALRQIAEWQSVGIELPVSVNVAARQFHRGNFSVRLGQMLAEYPGQAHLIEIELLETAVLDDVAGVSRLVEEYRQRGVRFDLDDFGTGYSSLIHLKRLAVDALKIDQSFVADMLLDPGDLTIVHGIINLASAFHLDVVSEGVEDIEHVLTLLELGCDVMQGFAIARPMPAESVPAWLHNFAPDPRWRLAGHQFPQRRDFDLLLAKVLHRFWLQSVLAAVESGQGDARWPEMDASRCRLSHWYAESGLRQFRGRPELGRFDRAHRDVHRAAQRLREEMEAGGSGRAALMGQLHEASDRLLRAIDAFQKLNTGEKKSDQKKRA